MGKPPVKQAELSEGVGGGGQSAAESRQKGVEMFFWGGTGRGNGAGEAYAGE